MNSQKKGVSDVLGAVLLLAIIFASSMVLLLAAGNLFVAVQDYHNAQALTSMESKENITVVYMPSIPPSGGPGVVVMNYGVATNITSLIEIGPGGVSYTLENIYLPSGASVPILESSQAAGVTTSYGGVFYDNYTTTAPGLVPVSIFGEGVSIQLPYSPGLWYVAGGTNIVLYSSGAATWYVNGTQTANDVSSANIVVNGPTTVTAVEDFYISVNSNPSGAGSVSPPSGWYPLGTKVTFSETPNNTSNTRHPFTGWSGTYSEPSSVTSFSEEITGPITETANYNTQYLVSVNSAYGTPNGAGWYNAGSTATISVNSPVSTGTGSQVVFSSWSGTLGSNNDPYSFTVNSPVTETANWIQQYYLTTAASPGAGGSAYPGSGWYDLGSSVTFSESPNSGSGYQYVFQLWSGTYYSDSQSFSETITGSITETANYQLQYYLTMNANPPNGGTAYPSSGWYDAGATASISEGANSGWWFHSWTGSGSGSYSGTAGSNSLVMNNAITETANFGGMPIILSNSQDTATPAPFQQEIQFTPADYGITNLNTIRFVDAAGNPLYAWLESYTGGTATIWVKLPGGIPASGSTTIYLDPAGGANFDGNYWGEAPQLSDPLSVTEWVFSGGVPAYPVGNSEPSGVTNVATGHLPNTYAYSTSQWMWYAGQVYLNNQPTMPWPSSLSMLGVQPPGGNTYGYTATGEFTVPSTGSYTFGIITDDGMEVFVNGPGTGGWIAVYNGNAWHGQGATGYWNSVTLQAGGTYQIAIDYFNSGGPGVSAFEAPVNFIGSYGEFDNGGNVFNYYWNFASGIPSGWGGITGNGVNIADGYSIWGSAQASSEQTNFAVGANSVVDWYGYFSAPSGRGNWVNNGLWGGQEPGWFTQNGQPSYDYGIINTIYNSNYNARNPEVFSVGFNSQTIYYWVNYGGRLYTFSYTGGTGWIWFRNGAGSGGGGGSTFYAQWARVRALPPNGVMPTVTID